MSLEKRKKALSKGKQGEELAARYLIEQGYTISRRNYRTKVGEIDIIAKKKDLLLFVEVKAYHKSAWVHPLETFNAAKQKRMIKASQLYQIVTHQEESPVRYDLIIIEKNTIQEHIKGVL